MGTQSVSGRPAKPLLVGSTPTPCSRFDDFPESLNSTVGTEEPSPQRNVQDAGEPKANPVGGDQIHEDSPMADIKLGDRIRFTWHTGCFTGEITSIDGDTGEVIFFYLCDPDPYHTSVSKLKPHHPEGYWLMDEEEVARIDREH